MKFSAADLLDQLQVESALPVADLEKKLALKSAKDQHQLQLALGALQSLGVLTLEEQGVSRSGSEELIEARLRCSSKGFCFALREGDSW